MIKIDFSKFLDIDSAGKKGELKVFCDKIKLRDVGFYKSLDEAEIKKIESFAKIRRDTFDAIAIIGIGGSSVGFQAVFGALENQMDKKVYFINDIDPEFIDKQVEQIDYSRTLFLITSKSGTTVETIAMFSYFWGKVPRKNFIFISEKNSFLHEIAKKHNTPFFSYSANIGGRFSVLSTVGMLPAALCGLDVREFLTGAKSVYKNFLDSDVKKNRCFQLATAHFIAHKKGYSNAVFWPYSQKLKNFGEWFKQLLAESIGKNGDGITPLLAAGVGAQHSILQNFIDGKNDKFFIFPHIKNLSSDEKIPEILGVEKFGFLKDKSFNNLLNAEFYATRDSLVEKSRPVLTLEIDEVSPQTLGEFFALFMGSKAFLGEFLNINPFDQPGVERSKVLVREYLFNEQ